MTLNTFEQAYGRLEQILEKMNSGKVSLEEALQLYEEADKLITFCQTRLGTAEQKIEMLVKNRAGAIAVNAQEQPITEPFAGLPK